MSTITTAPESIPAIPEQKVPDHRVTLQESAILSPELKKIALKTGAMTGATGFAIGALLAWSLSAGGEESPDSKKGETKVLALSGEDLTNTYKDLLEGERIAIGVNVDRTNADHAFNTYSCKSLYQVRVYGITSARKLQKECRGAAMQRECETLMNDSFKGNKISEGALINGLGWCTYNFDKCLEEEREGECKYKRK